MQDSLLKPIFSCLVFSPLPKNVLIRISLHGATILTKVTLSDVTFQKIMSLS